MSRTAPGEKHLLSKQFLTDTAYRSWRKLGDVIASIFALGYHEARGTKSDDSPPFLVELRRAAFARVYSADKNFAIFLGRPPRMSKKFCDLQLPLSRNGLTEDWSTPSEANAPQEWAEICYRADTRWSALCASLKDEILEMPFDQGRGDCHDRARYVYGCLYVTLC